MHPSSCITHRDYELILLRSDPLCITMNEARGTHSDVLSLFELLISKSYTNAAVSILLSVEVLSRKAPVRCLPNACLRRGGALLSPNLFYQPIEIAYSNRLSATLYASC